MEYNKSDGMVCQLKHVLINLNQLDVKDAKLKKCKVKYFYHLLYSHNNRITKDDQIKSINVHTIE